ncbi:MAG: hypothetical protein COU07_01015 [Candidatus Harrisonbacteria bacterium CG10_big_fil_rev_8_21_14_0_10_40_38]|uniref:Uncharacterized protein n=1 Tax=Candidatus Harrisonbacteria bacterium CG10_big_fil_rev_8_21_14_0_10_40_38 TaxID=1974583 RepID=A0A2H0UUM9_9BACT|nr:MAG: hypothetical protein COU07_01015 [Candidatus Harrisonbacteria bacterium CG10_big_fil_rev_8_21_14_0_10_40_38]
MEPATTVVTARAQQDRTAAGVIDGFVHCDDPSETHGFDLLVCELLTNEAGQFGIRFWQLALGGLGANLLRDPIVVLKETAQKNGDFGREALGWLEARRTEHLLGGVTYAEAVAFQTLDPVLAGRAVRGDREVDDTVFLAPFSFLFRNHKITTKELINSFLATENVPHGLNAIHGSVVLCHFVLLAHIEHLG